MAFASRRMPSGDQPKPYVLHRGNVAHALHFVVRRRREEPNRDCTEDETWGPSHGYVWHALTEKILAFLCTLLYVQRYARGARVAFANGRMPPVDAVDSALPYFAGNDRCAPETGWAP